MAEPKFVFSEKDYEFDDEELEIERAEATKIYFREVAPRLEEKLKKEYQKLKNQSLYNRLYDDAIAKGINVDNLFKDIEYKRRALKNILGYKELRGLSSIDEASDQAIANVYKKAYYSSKQAKRLISQL